MQKDEEQLATGPIRAHRSSAKALLITILRTIPWDKDRPIWTATLIKALALCGVESGNARQAISRIAEGGILRSEKVGARTRWYVTEAGRQRFTIARKRFAEFGVMQREWDGEWLVVICSVPEEQRVQRRLFRARLTYGGFGFANPGVAVSPHVAREAYITEVLDEFGLTQSALVFKARSGDVVSDSDLIQRAWNLEELAAQYAEFVETFDTRPAEDGEEQFAAFIALQHDWLHFVFTDPEIPRSLLPTVWLGDSAKALFERREREWRGAAVRWFEALDAAIG